MYDEDITSIVEEIGRLKLNMDGCYLVTGGTGFIGSYIIRTLLFYTKKGSNIKVIAPVRNIKKARKMFGSLPNLIFVPWEMEHELIVDEHIDYVIHAASPVGATYFLINPYDTMKQNLLGCIHIIHLCKRIYPQKIVYIGSASSYGNKICRETNEPISEELLGDFRSMNKNESYSISKLGVEYLLACASEQLKIQTMVVRLFSVYGPGMDFTNGSVTTDLFRQAIYSDQLIIKGNGVPVRNFGYITDIISGVFIVLHRGSTGEAYNLGSMTENYSIYDFAKHIRSHLLKPTELIVSDLEKGRKIQNSMQIPELKKANSLGWQSYISLDCGIRKILKFYKTI